jgi:cell division protein ZapA
MPHVSVTIAGRTFRMACEDGEEERLSGLAQKIDLKIAEMRAAFGEIGDNRLTVMAAITVADELAEAQRLNGALRDQIAELERARDDALAQKDQWAQAAADAVEAVTGRLEEMVHAMNVDGRRATRND